NASCRARISGLTTILRPWQRRSSPRAPGFSGRIALGRSKEPLATAAAAEVVRAPAILGSVRCRPRDHRHAADRIALARLPEIERRYRRPLAGAAELHDLRQNAEGDLFRRASPDVQACG